MNRLRAIAIALPLASCGSDGGGSPVPPTRLLVDNFANVADGASCNFQLRLERPAGGEAPRFFQLGACASLNIDLAPGDWNVFVSGDAACKEEVAQTVRIIPEQTTAFSVDCGDCSDCP